MRPLRITIEGLRSFRGEVGIAFGNRTQIAVIGDTGAGKSSILEAMTYALYGQTSLGGRSKQELMNDTSDVMRVVLRFRVASEEWEVTRVDRRAGAGGRRPPQAQLVRYGPDGKTLEKVEQVRQVNDRVQALIGLDSDAFLRTVILPQGRFARLLVEDAPSKRTEILRQVCRTHDLEAAGEVAEKRLREVRTLAARLEDEVQRHPPDPEAHLADLTSRAEAAERQANALADLRDRSIRAWDTVRQSEETIKAARMASEHVIPSAMDDLATQLAPVELAQHRIRAQATELEDREASLKRDLNGIPTDDGPDHHEIAHTLAALDAIQAKMATAVDAAEGLRAAVSGEAAAERHHAQARKALESASDRLAGHQGLEPPLSEAVESTRNLVTEAERRYVKCHELRERIHSNEGGVATRKQGLADTTARLAAAQRDLHGAEEHLRRTERELNEARRTNAAAAAAHGLRPGEECPICESDLPEEWVAPQDTGLDAVREVHEEARSRAKKANQVVAEVEAQYKSVQREIGSIEKELDALRSEIAAALDRLRSAAGLDDAFPLAGDAPVPDRAEVLAPVHFRLREAEAKLSAHRTEYHELQQVQINAQLEENTARETLDHARDAVLRTRGTAGEALDALNQRIRSIPPPFRPHLVLPSDPVELETVDTTPVERASYTAREREEILQLRERKRKRLRTEIDETRTALKHLGETRGTEVEKPLQDLLCALADHRTALADAVRRLGADLAIPGAIHFPVEAETLRAGIGRLREAMVEVAALAADLGRRALAASDEAHGKAGRIARQLDPPTDPTDLEALVQSTGRAADEARYTARDATRLRDSFAAIFDDLLQLGHTADEVAALKLALGDLDATLKPGAFLKWLTLRRSRDLLVYASRMLREMTAGRYSFADPGNLENQQWLVVDNDSGQARSPASLSGGEQFIGSLALALGMVEMMARSGGRLESLFLDEGFGSLDRSNLDSAIEALSLVAGTGRMVGVISHVAAVAEQIDDVLVVERNASGSQMHWLSRAQRQELARSDTGLEGTSALAGLLE